MPRIQTVVRIRPQLNNETVSGLLQNTDQGISLNLEGQLKQFTFDNVYDQKMDTRQLCESIDIDQMIDKFFEGYSQTICAYGQTGSGKTYTIEGSNEQHGLVALLIDKLYQRREKIPQQNIMFEMRCSYLQIYNEHVYDMLNFKKDQSKGLILRYRNDDFYVENLLNLSCASHQEMISQYHYGCRCRIIASNLLNENSSRSHCIFTIQLERTNTLTNETVLSKFHIVDLAGSERISQTQAQGQQLLECAQINKSLFTLRQVIKLLSQRVKFIPYRDSKLTSILKNSLIGNSFVIMIICVSPANENLQQTFQSLLYGAKARTISIDPQIVKDPKSQQLEALRNQIKLLHQQLSQALSQIDSQNKIIEQLKKGFQENQEQYNSLSRDKEVSEMPLIQPTKINNFVVEQKQPVKIISRQVQELQKLNNSQLEQLHSQNLYISNLLEIQQKQDNSLSQILQGLQQNKREIENIQNENQDLRERILIFEQVLSKDLQKQKSDDIFKQDWKELFKITDTQKSSILETMIEVTNGYKKSYQDLLKQYTQEMQSTTNTRNRSFDQSQKQFYNKPPCSRNTKRLPINPYLTKQSTTQKQFKLT